MGKMIFGLAFLFIHQVYASELEYHPAEPSGKPFSQAVQAGGLIFLSGRLGVVDGKLAEGGIGPETRAAMESIKKSLDSLGSSMNRVVKCTVFLADIAEWSKMNEVYVTYFKKNPPARSAIGSTALAANASVEIECIAAAGE
jgi:2-iminobutanoate/2-iminopropanoate deaminase